MATHPQERRGRQGVIGFRISPDTKLRLYLLMGHRWPDGDKDVLVCCYGEGDVIPEHSDHSGDLWPNLRKTIQSQYPIPGWMRGTSSDKRDGGETHIYKKLADKGMCNPLDGRPAVETRLVSDGAFLGIARFLEELTSEKAVAAHSFGSASAVDGIRVLAGPISLSSGHVKITEGGEEHFHVELSYVASQDVVLHIDHGPNGRAVVDAFLVAVYET